MLLTNIVHQHMKRCFSDDQYIIGQDSGIYWRLTDPPPLGAVSPSWYLVLGVPPMLNGQMRNSYVLWHEHIAPLIILEFSYDDFVSELDRTPNKGKFWIYENVIRPNYYVIFNIETAELKVHQHVHDAFHTLTPNERNCYSIKPLKLDLGVWQGKYFNLDANWLRWWHIGGQLFLTHDEWLEQRETYEQNVRKANQDRARADLFAQKLRELGINPDEIKA